jgi:hypothetical protein
MSRKKEIAEFDILELYVSEMESQGVNRNLITISVDESIASKLHERIGIKVTLDNLQRLADICLANEWLEHRTLAGKYGELGLTATGYGVVRSRQRKAELLANRSVLKKVSDYIEDHKGLFVALGAVVAIVSLLLKFFVG